MTTEYFLGDCSVTETCKILSFTPPTIYRLINKGLLDSYKIGRSRRITRESIDRIRNENTSSK